MNGPAERLIATLQRRTRGADEQTEPASSRSIRVWRMRPTEGKPEELTRLEGVVAREQRLNTRDVVVAALFAAATLATVIGVALL